MYEPILTIKKMLKGEHYFYKNVKRVIISYKGETFAFDKEKVWGWHGTKFIPIELFESGQIVYVSKIEFEDEEGDKEYEYEDEEDE